MAKRPVKHLEQLLESDDDLPSELEEIAEEPAYKNDNRFDSNLETIQFPWIENTDWKCRGLNKSISSHSQSTHNEIQFQGLEKIQTEDTEKVLIRKGVLSKQDIYCMRCIGAFSSDETILWFIDFLMQKDLQSDYKFLKSCLVGDAFETVKDTKITEQRNAKNYKYDIIVKM